MLELKISWAVMKLAYNLLYEDVQVQGYSLTFNPRVSYYGNFKYLLRSHWANCKQILGPSGAEGTEKYSDGLGHMTKMAVMPVYSKTFKNLLL